MPILQIEATLQSSHLRHQYGIFGGKSQTSFSRNATRAGSKEGRLFSQASANSNERYLELGQGHSLPPTVIPDILEVDKVHPKSSEDYQK